MEDSLAGELLMFVFTLGEIRSSSTTNKPLYTLLKMSENLCFFTFSLVIEMKHWLEMS